MKNKFIIISNYIISKNDGQKHFITLPQLLSCYKVSVKDVLLESSLYELFKLQSEYYLNCKLLTPRHSGNYDIKTCITLKEYFENGNVLPD